MNVQAEVYEEVRSNWILREIVPGQIHWDNARTAFGGGEYWGALLNVAAMVSEQVMSVLLLGQGPAIAQSGRALTKSVQQGLRSLRPRAHIVRDPDLLQVFAKGSWAPTEPNVIRILPEALDLPGIQIGGRSLFWNPTGLVTVREGLHQTVYHEAFHRFLGNVPGLHSAFLRSRTSKGLLYRTVEWTCNNYGDARMLLRKKYGFKSIFLPLGKPY